MRFFCLLIFLGTVLSHNSAFSQIFIPVSYWKCDPNYVLYQSDAVTADFSNGTFSNTNTSGNSVVLSVGQSTGTFTSKIFDIFAGCPAMAPWYNLKWTSSIPFGKELPISSETATDYASITAGLTTNLIGLWHLNESAIGTAPGTKDFADSTTNNNHAVKTGNITLNVAGRFTNGVLSNNTGGYIDFPGVNTLISNTGSYTIAAWFKVTSFTNGCSGAGTYLLDRSVAGNPLAGICIKTSAYAMETRCDSGADLGQAVGAAVVTGTWQHVAIQRDRANNLYRIFVDGVAGGTRADTGCATTPSVFRFLRHATGGTNGLNGSADEFAVWSRALSAAEILQVYRRGANRLKFQVKSCVQPNCSDIATWLGPNGTNSTYFTEINNNGIPNTGLGTVLTTSPNMIFANFPSLTIPTNRFFQYQTTFETDNTTYSPDITSVRVERGCAVGSQVFSADGTFTLPTGCTTFTVTAKGAGGGGGIHQSGTAKPGGNGGQAIMSFSNQIPGTNYTVTIGKAGVCSQTGGAGGYTGGSGGNSNPCTVGGVGGGTGTGGTGGAKVGAGCIGGAGKYGGAGGGGAAGGLLKGAGAGGATTFKNGATDYVIAGGGGGAGIGDQGTAGTGGPACWTAITAGSASYNGANGGAAVGGDASGGGGGGACYCYGGTCNSTPTNGGGAGGAAINASGCGGSGTGTDGSLTVTWP